ncbi:hypothetical protein CDAR_422691 [Caerostris darwini]|uniref:Uncharacterized protein n=1 Tax=Caerostris darwini TaxID=1538125 RepID=A0AAV4SHA5_9ARAC|nr:hypothetical protein CDAR_422691 [Caerostris darwini]
MGGMTKQIVPHIPQFSHRQRILVHRIPFAPQHTLAMTFPADAIDYAFFGAEPPASTHCLNCFFVSGV